MKIWIDIKNSHEPMFFNPLIKNFSNHDFKITARNYAEIVSLLELFKMDFTLVGKHYGEHIINKIIGRGMLRNFELLKNVSFFDIALSHMSLESVLISKLKSKKSIAFYDNEIKQLYVTSALPFLDYFIVPDAINIQALLDLGASKESIIQYGGYKEDLYVASYTPDPDFSKKIPFESFVAIRPEALKAAYVSNKSKTIVPQILKLLQDEGINIILLPRYPSDVNLGKGFDNVYIPPSALNGLDICYHSDAVLTGSGTLAREAACLGTPSVSFYPDPSLLAVDRKMIKDNKIFHSRSPNEIVRYILKSEKIKIDFQRSRNVQTEVFSILESIFSDIKS